MTRYSLVIKADDVATAEKAASDLGLALENAAILGEVAREVVADTECHCITTLQRWLARDTEFPLPQGALLLFTEVYEA